HVYDADGACRPNQELPYHFADRAEAGEPIDVHGDGEAHRDYLHLGDAVRAIGLAVEGPVTGTVTVGSPRTPTIAELADAAREAFGITLVVIEHDLPLLMDFADRMLALDLGAVVASGTPEEVRQAPRVVEAYLG
ncbi:MAG: NAD-dependent epimerase/dehydratase family protein, partial [Actinomycetota bacterium]